MTETATTPASFRIPLARTDASPRSAADAAPSPRRRARLAMPTWLPRRILQRGGVPTREDARALHDLRAALDRSDW
ncbi:hypothetical protein [Microbacterium sp. 13-71-7]|uniref:hypothetical protein n=1 Tax=Microbacterium sp. 13-71-7 TaxID=1970399 RepID=UPI000BCFAA56|nr:hypothetical protein [Microbacterium sp. 13-71-7]OZB81303.1 MAG: hypothetical protein B7X32_17215 [Microbacterium sp. 13-71-7]